MLVHTNNTTTRNTIASGVGPQSPRSGLRPAAATVLLSLFTLANGATAAPPATAALTLGGTNTTARRTLQDAASTCDPTAIHYRYPTRSLARPVVGGPFFKLLRVARRL